MKPINKRLIGLIVLAIIQLSFPLLFIAAKERVIETGNEYLFRIQPVDPYNFFQGRYASLNVEPLDYTTTDWQQFKRNDIIYAEFRQDSTGAEITAISHKKTKHSLKLKLAIDPAKTMRIRLPFRKFFLEESKAQFIEERLARNPDRLSFVHVKILNGDFVMTDISSNGKSLITGKTVKRPE